MDSSMTTPTERIPDPEIDRRDSQADMEEAK